MLCECGCGETVSLVTKTNNKWGYIKGQPVRFIRGHYIRVNNPGDNPEIRARMTAANKGKKRSLETRAKISKNHADVTGEKNPFYGKHLSNETKTKISKANTGRTVTPETRKKISKAGKGRIHFSETRTKISTANKGHVLSPETKMKIAKAQTGKTPSSETRMKMSIANMGRIVSLEVRAKMSGKNNPSWRGGVSFEPYCKVFNNKEWREIIYDRDKDKFCWNPLCTGRGSKETLHHIDYNKKECNPVNIIKICNSCNAIANGDRDWWKGFYTALQEKRGIMLNQQII